jgi:glycosyltransferase involved in cell wall biosynthesis
MEKFVSVIIPTYNRSALLQKAIDSVLNQTHVNLELVIVDDGSGDDTGDLIDRYKKISAKKIVAVHQKNKGPAAARNSGIAVSSSEYIAFLDSDDWLHPDKIGLQLAVMEGDAKCLISHTQEIWYRDGKLLNQRNKHRKESGYIFNRCLDLCAVSMSTVMLKNKLIDQVGTFDEQLPCCEDYDYWLRVSAKFPFKLVDKALTYKDGGRADQVSFIHRTGMDRYRIQAIAKILDSGELSASQHRTALHELEKKCSIYGNGCIKHNRSEEGEHYLLLPAKYGFKGDLNRGLLKRNQ